MAFDTKLNLNNGKFEQVSGDTLSLSGITTIFGDIKISESSPILPTAQSLATREFVTGNSITFNNGITKAGTNVRLGGTLTGNTVINFNNNTLNLSGTTLSRVLSGRTVTLKNNDTIAVLNDQVKGADINDYYLDFFTFTELPNAAPTYIKTYEDQVYFTFNTNALISTNGGGLYFFDSGRGQGFVYSATSGNYTGDQYYNDPFRLDVDPTTNTIYSLFFTNLGFSVLDAVGNSNTFYNNSSGNYTGDLLPTGVNGSYRNIFFDSNTNKLWITVAGQGVIRFDLNTSTSVLFNAAGIGTKYTGSTLSNNVVNKVVSAGGYIWISTSNGIFRFNESTSGMTLFSTTSGNYTGSLLPSNNVSSTNEPIVDNAGNLWFISANNLWSINPTTLIATGYTSSSGNYSGDLFGSKTITGLKYSSSRNEIYYNQSNTIGCFQLNTATNRFFPSILAYTGGTSISILDLNDQLQIAAANSIFTNNGIWSISYPQASPFNLLFDSGGLYYSGDFSSYFSTNNLVTKKYVDDNKELIQNGLSRLPSPNNNVVELGGELIKNTTVGGQFIYNLNLGDGDSLLNDLNIGAVGGMNVSADTVSYHITTDFQISGDTAFSGITYADDYSSKFKKYSLVDKNFVTGYTSSNVATASNGLTKHNNNNIVLGGSLTGDTTIGGAGNSLYFGDFNVSEFNEFIVAVSGTSGLIGLYGKDDAIIEISTNHTTQNSIVISAGLSGDNSTINIDYQKLRLSSNDSEPSNVFIELSGASKIVIGENNFSDFAGIQYLTDYSANYTARSIPDVGFVTGYTSPQNIYNQKIIVSANTTLTNTNFVVFVDSSTSGLTITLPASPVDGQVYKIKDVGSANINNIIIDGNGNTIDGFPTAIINTQRGGIEIVYDQTIDEWALLNYIL